MRLVVIKDNCLFRGEWRGDPLEFTMHNLLRPAGEIRASLKLICSFALRNAFLVESAEYRVERAISCGR